MQLAFLILAHQYPDQVSKLIKTLIADQDVSVFVHVDERAPGVHQKLHERFANEKRVVLIEKRYRVFWGSFNQVRATLELIHTANQSGKFEYYSLISGQDLPIKPIAAFKEFLQLNKGKEFLAHYPLPHYENHGATGGLDRMELYWLDAKPKLKYLRAKTNDVIHKFQNTLKLKRKVNFNLHSGFQWFTLSNDAVNYILEFLAKDPSFFNSFKHTRCSDEIFFQTLLLNSPLKENVVNDCLRYIDWQSGPEYPKVLRMEDHSNLVNSKDKFFARKFDEKVDSNIIEKFTAPA